MAEKINRKTISVDIDVELHKRAKILSAKTGIPVLEFYERGLRDQLGAAEGSPDTAGTAMKPRDRAAHERLQYILDHGSKEKVEWITGNLKAFAEGIEQTRSTEEVLEAALESASPAAREKWQEILAWHRSGQPGGTDALRRILNPADQSAEKKTSVKKKSAS